VSDAPPAAPASPQPFRIVAPALRRLAIVLWVVAVALVPIAIAGNGPSAALLALPPSAFTAWFAWMALWRPRVEATPDALVVVDVRRTTTIAWPRVEEVRSRYGLEVRTNEGLLRAWIAPRPTARLRLDTIRPDGRPGGTEPVTVPAAADRLAACVPVREPLDGPPPARVTVAGLVTHGHWWGVLLLVVLGVLGSLTGARL